MATADGGQEDVCRSKVVVPINGTKEEKAHVASLQQSKNFVQDERNDVMNGCVLARGTAPFLFF